MAQRGRINGLARIARTWPGVRPVCTPQYDMRFVQAPPVCPSSASGTGLGYDVGDVPEAEEMSDFMRDDLFGGPFGIRVRCVNEHAEEVGTRVAGSRHPERRTTGRVGVDDVDVERVGRGAECHLRRAQSINTQLHGMASAQP